ncbi:MAG: CHRD domain-containing protein [Vicinamibacteria bacterium]|nr:CHRD domain-containing protein [Vicinamibacteria bacterium]
MTRAGLLRLSTAFVASVCLSGLVASAQSQGNRYSATLVPGQENPALSTPAWGTITLNINEAAGEIDYELSYTGLVDVRQAHIHFEKPALNGGIMLWLCKTATNQGPTPGTTPDCPVGSGSASGTLLASNVLGIATQRLAAGDFVAAVAQIRNGLAYANVHTAVSPGGEIRGQITQGGGHK